MLRSLYIRGFVFAALIASPFIVFAQTPSIDALEAQLSAARTEYAERMERLSSLEERIAARELSERNDYAARLAAAKKNFVVKAPTPAIADKICEAAALEWMKSNQDGKLLFKPIPIHCKVGQVGAGGSTTFSFAGGEVFGWQMNVQGSLERICDSVIPHEMCHVFNALDARQPLPRWGDEGGSTLAEEYTERRRQWKLAEEVLGTSRFIPIAELLRMKEYPKEMSRVLTLYAEGTVLSEFLVSRASAASGRQWTQEEARQWMVSFMVAGDKFGWDAALYNISNQLGGVSNVAELSREFNKWMRSGAAQIYTFKEVAPAAGQNVILPVNYFDAGKNKVVPAN